MRHAILEHLEILCTQIGDLQASAVLHGSREYYQSDVHRDPVRSLILNGMLGLGEARGNWQKNYREPETLDLEEWRKDGFDRHSTAAKISADFNPDKLELTWSVQGDISSAPAPADDRYASTGPADKKPNRRTK